MKIIIIALGFCLILAAQPVAADSHKPAEKAGYSGHFGDMDTNGNAGVDWKEFKAHFPHAEERFFKEADANQDQKIDHDEWHDFKDKYGYGHQEENKHEKRK